MIQKLLILSLFVFAPACALAASIQFGDYFLKGAETVQDDLYTLGDTVIFEGRITGDAAALARTIFSESTTTGDVLFVGEEVRLRGAVGDDARLLGGTVTIDGVVEDDVVAIGGEVNIAPNARIRGSLYAMGGTVRIFGSVVGDARVVSGRMELHGEVAGNVELWGTASFKTPARIGGDFVYHTDGKASPPVNVAITGKVVMDEREKGESAFSLGGFRGGFLSLRTLMALALGFALFFFARERSEELLLDLLPNVGMRLTRGALIVLLLPAAGALLFPTVVGIPLTLILGACLLVALLLGWAYAGFLAGAWSERFFFRRSPFPLSYRPVLLGIIFLSVLSAIPVLGPLLHLALSLAAVGSLGTVFYRHMRQN
jgi:cytoskeletal protein CcmA (bactofilin family)